MPSSVVSVSPPRLSAYRRRAEMFREAGFSLVTLLGVAALYESSAPSVPLATAVVLAASTAAAMQVRLAMGRTPAAMQIVACGFMISLMGALPRLVGETIVTGLVGAELVARCPHRSRLVRVGLWTGGLAGITVVSGLLAAVPQAFAESVREALAAAAGGFIAAPLTLAVAPLAERWFGHVTRWTLNEWLSYEHPLLRDLATKAPGTFQHSVNVGVLADSAASMIGSDAVLARLGGLYHDVGKARGPEYFTENQYGPNPHDRLSPWESARILRAHVSDGLDLLERHRMGPRLAAFVAEHHGTGLMRLFHGKAVALGSTATTRDTYRYAGPRPRSRETAIVMMADQIEATARSAPPADEQDCEGIVQRTLDRIQSEGQLDESGLTAADIVEVHRGLTRSLQAMYHRRLAYPVTATGVPPSKRAPVLTRLFGRRRA